MRDNKKVFILILCIVMSFLGIYMQFSRGGTKEAERRAQEEEGKEGQTEMREESLYDYQGQELPDFENVSEEGAYTDGTKIEIYFENTEVLDHGSLPLSVQAGITKYTQKYLNQNGYSDVTELYVEEESYEEDAEKIIFRCYMDGHEEILQIEYRIGEGKLCFLII